ncbi:MAG TPA: hypothetical protein V6D08_00325 [Candidatus Obscuribacterales bacterium]
MRLLEKQERCALVPILAFCLYLAAAGPIPADETPPEAAGQSGAPPASDQPPVPEPMPVPVGAPKPGKPLQGGLNYNELWGGAQQTPLTGGMEGGGGTTLTGGAQSGGWAGAAQQAMPDQWRTGPLQGGAAQNPMALSTTNDPDAGNQELEIEWDRWRNTLMQAIQAGTLAKINVQNDINFVFDPRSNMMVSRYPNGTSAWYAIDVLPDRRIVNIRLTSSSRYPSYDQAVLQAIQDLQGNSILTYPRGSRRQIVSQEASVKTASQSSSQTYQWGDVERQRY